MLSESEFQSLLGHLKTIRNMDLNVKAEALDLMDSIILDTMEEGVLDKLVDELSEYLVGKS